MSVDFAKNVQGANSWKVFAMIVLCDSVKVAIAATIPIVAGLP